MLEYFHQIFVQPSDLIIAVTSMTWHLTYRLAILE